MYLRPSGSVETQAGCACVDDQLEGTPKTGNLNVVIVRSDAGLQTFDLDFKIALAYAATAVDCNVHLEGFATVDRFRYDYLKSLTILNEGTGYPFTGAVG